MDKIILDKIKKTVHTHLAKKRIKINRLVLFGSYAAGNYTEDSDLDLIIVSESFRHKKYSDRISKSLGINRALVKMIDLPVDLLYYSDEEWENSATLVIREAKRYGITI